MEEGSLLWVQLCTVRQEARWKPEVVKDSLCRKFLSVTSLKLDLPPTLRHLCKIHELLDESLELLKRRKKQVFIPQKEI